MRDLYLTCRSFRSRVTDFIRYRRVTHNMQTAFPDATEEELDAADRICIICREHMTAAKKLCAGMFPSHHPGAAAKKLCGSTGPPWQPPPLGSVRGSSAAVPQLGPAPPQGAPGSSGQLGTLRKRPGCWAPRHRLGSSS